MGSRWVVLPGVGTNGVTDTASLTFFGDRPSAILAAMNFSTSR
jgi:hypothetical protein